jgi:hypothetical protein
VTRYRCVDVQKAAGFPVVAACQAAGVTRSAHYAWTTSTAQGPAPGHQEEVRLVREIRRIHARSSGTYGAPRATAELRRRGQVVNHKRVERLMRTHGIVGHRPRRRRSSTPWTVRACLVIPCSLLGATAVRAPSPPCVTRWNIW